MKWYLNGTEVVSFMPHRNETLQLFASHELPITIESDTETTSAVIPSDLIIRDVTWSCEGTWKCEVSADHSFQKDEKVVHMTVIGELPGGAAPP